MDVWVWYQDWHSYLKSPLQFFSDLHRNIRYAWQRAWRGWSDDWVWGINYTLAELVPELLQGMKENGHGVPTTLYASEDELEDNLEKRMVWHASQAIITDDDRPNEDQQLWFGVLDDIAEGFRAAQRLSEDFYKDKLQKQQDMEKFEKGIELFRRYYFDLWD